VPGRRAVHGVHHAPEHAATKSVPIERSAYPIDEPEAFQRRIRIVVVGDQVVVEPVAKGLLVLVEHASEGGDGEHHPLERGDPERADREVVALDRRLVAEMLERAPELRADLVAGRLPGGLAADRVSPALIAARHDARLRPAAEELRDPLAVTAGERDEVLDEVVIGLPEGRVHLAHAVPADGERRRDAGGRDLLDDRLRARIGAERAGRGCRGDDDEPRRVQQRRQ
jgi:hypothetical protein